MQGNEKKRWSEDDRIKEKKKKVKNITNESGNLKMKTKTNMDKNVGTNWKSHNRAIEVKHHGMKLPLSIIMHYIGIYVLYLLCLKMNDLLCFDYERR